MISTITTFKYGNQFYHISNHLLPELNSLANDLMLYGSNPEKKSGNPYKLKLVEFISKQAVRINVVEL